MVHESKDRFLVVIPEIGKLTAGRQFRVRAFDSQLAALGITIHIVLTTSANHVPLCTIGDAVVVVIHVIRIDLMGEVGIFMADHLIPGVVGMKGIGVVPRVVHHFGAAVIVGSHHKGNFSSKIHEPLGFGLVFITIGVRTSMWVGIVAVHVYAVGILSSGTIDCVIAAMVGAVGVGIRADVKVDVVHHVLHLGLIWILKQIVDKAEHQNPSRGLVAVDGRSVEELGFAFSCAVVEVRNHDFAATGQRAEGDDFWNMTDEECISLAVKELESMGIISSADILDSHREKVKKAYPAYFDTYAQIDELIKCLDSYENLYCVGRNGQHRYNNMDHSMLTAIKAAQAIKAGKTDKNDIWNVNTEKEYHEQKSN